MILEPYLQLCIRAHNWTSHWPEKRGRYYVDTYSKILAEDLAALPEQNREDYQTRFVSLFVAWMHRKSNCFSSFITGGSKFPVRRAEKANRAEEKAYEIFEAFRTRYFKRLNRKAKVGLDGELEKALLDLKKAEERRIMIKRANKLVKKPNALELLIQEGWSEKNAQELLEKDFTGHIGFAPYHLQNLGANIRRLQDRVTYLSEKVKLRSETGNEEIPMLGGTCLINRDEDRIQLLFDEKPSRDLIDKLKATGWHWSPTNKAWQRKITPAAEHAARMLIRIELAL